MAVKLRTLAPLVKMRDTRIAPPAPKAVDPFYLTPEYRAWRSVIVARAGGRCEVSENGFRCTKAEPKHRMFADHIEERRDNGAPLDPANGQCLCGRHHTLKTASAKTARMAIKTTLIARGG